MADNYTQFSEMIPCETGEQQEWLMQKIAVAVEDDEGEAYPACEFEAEGKDVWVCARDSGDVSALTDVVATFQNVFEIREPWALTWAGTCSKPRVGQFGGGGVVVCKGKVYWMDTWGWCIAEVKRLQEETP